MYEDTEEIVKRVPIDDIPKNIPRIKSAEITQRERLSGPVFTVTYRGERHAMKVHESAYQNTLFQTELDARIKLGMAPHVSKSGPEWFMIRQSMTDPMLKEFFLSTAVKGI